MISGNVDTLLAQLEGRSNGLAGDWSGLSTDTRTLGAGELFIALDGPNFSGSDFVAEAKRKGAGAAIVQLFAASELAQVAVPDTRHALGVLAAEYRRSLTMRVAGVTGSNGKTTVKQMLAACLGADVYATRGNLNNDIGVPLSLFELNESHRYGVIEMGANHHGEIAYLASLARPDVAIITNAGPAHLDGFGSIEGVAHAKGELFYSLDEDGVAILNQDDVYYELWLDLAEPATTMSFGSNATADCFASEIQLNATGSRFKLNLAGEVLPVELPIPGKHNVTNACAAALAAFAMGESPTDIAIRLGKSEAESHRLLPEAVVGGRLLIDDSYNANPASMRAAAEFAVALGAPVWMALGDMGELGAKQAQLHRQLGTDLANIGVSNLFVTGELSTEMANGFGDLAEHYDSRDALTKALIEAWPEGVTLVVKGSRTAAMEHVVTALMQEFERAKSA